MGEPEFNTVETPDERGQALVEYALILGLVSVVCIVSLTAIGTSVSSVIQQLASAIA